MIKNYAMQTYIIFATFGVAKFVKDQPRALCTGAYTCEEKSSSLIENIRSRHSFILRIFILLSQRPCLELGYEGHGVVVPNGP